MRVLHHLALLSVVAAPLGTSPALAADTPSPAPAHPTVTSLARALPATDLPAAPGAERVSRAPAATPSGPETDTPRDYLETFDDPFQNWRSGWFYRETNAESYYYASGNCDPNYRGNQPYGMWISDDRGCGQIRIQSPVRIEFPNRFADDAVLFEIDMFTCVPGVTFNIYDRSGRLAVSESLTSNCWNFSHYSWRLQNGMSAFEWAYTAGQVEGNTSIDNVHLQISPGCALQVFTSDFPRTVRRGETASFLGTVINPCDSTVTFDEARVDIEGPIQTSVSVYQGPPAVPVPPRGSQSATVRLPVPLSAPPDTYTVTAVILSDGVEVDADSFQTVVE